MRETYSALAEGIISLTPYERVRTLDYFKVFYIEATTEAGFDTETIRAKTPDLTYNGRLLLEGLMASLSIIDPVPSSPVCRIFEYGKIMNLIDVSNEVYAELETSLKRKYTLSIVDTWKHYLKSIQETILQLIESKK